MTQTALAEETRALARFGALLETEGGVALPAVARQGRRALADAASPDGDGAGVRINGGSTDLGALLLQRAAAYRTKPESPYLNKNGNDQTQLA